MEKECGHESFSPGDTMTPNTNTQEHDYFIGGDAQSFTASRTFERPSRADRRGCRGTCRRGGLPGWAIAHSGSWIEMESGSRYRGGDFGRVPPPCHCWKPGGTRYNPRRTSDSRAIQIA